MKKEIIELMDKISITDDKAEKALTILSDLYQDYGYMEDEPSAKEAEKYAHEAKRIFQFISISYDYVYGVKKELKKAYDDLNMLYDQVREANVAPADDDKSGSYKEQINAVLNNMNAAELKKVYSFALNIMISEGKA